MIILDDQIYDLPFTVVSAPAGARKANTTSMPFGGHFRFLGAPRAGVYGYLGRIALSETNFVFDQICTDDQKLSRLYRS